MSELRDPVHVWLFILTIGCILILPDNMKAQWEVAIKGPKDSPTALATEISDETSNTISGPTQTLVVTCDGEIKCTELKISITPVHTPLAVYPKAGIPATGSKVEFTLNRDRIAKLKEPKLVITLGNKTISTYALATSTQPKSASGNENAEISPIEILSSRLCSEVYPTGNEFIVTPLGDVLATPRRQLNEGDRVTVAIVADSRIAESLHAVRRSEFRPIRVSNILGSNTTLPNIDDLNGRQALDEEPTCVVKNFVLNNFAPGRGQVDILTGKEVSGTFDFRVNELYTGMFGLGAVRSRTHDPSFGTVITQRDTTINGAPSRLADTVVTETKNHGDRLLYVLTYTPFVWGARDISEAPPNFLHRLNPMVGIVLNDIPKNGLVGLALELGSNVFLIGGIHAAKRTIIDPNSGLAVGDRIGSTEVPTTTKWQYRAFWGVEIDLLAAVSFLKAAGSGTAH